MPLASELVKIFEERADGVRSSAIPLVGVFGEGVPKPVIAAAGGLALDVKAPPLRDAIDEVTVRSVSLVLEDFMDMFATRFLHRLAAGAFDHFAMIIFARDDVAALAAYQYARELQRQGHIPSTGPKLYLWNLLHTDSNPAHRFNLLEFEKLTTNLGEISGQKPSEENLARAFSAEAHRIDAVAKLPTGGSDAFIARNAGRWLAPANHIALLSEVAATPTNVRISLVGTACDIPILHEICDGFGTIVNDLQEYGRLEIAPASADPNMILKLLATDDLHIRSVPPKRYTQALINETKNADLVISSVDQNDDAFGWEVPGLRNTVEARGGKFLDLGFRPFRPDAEWCEKAQQQIAEVLA